ncbi:MAG: hypothetical protein HYV97_15810 [Bdellovibrio sp.]|nr:hypothetical protein [Bdellovibrio sp.]
MNRQQRSWKIVLPLIRKELIIELILLLRMSSSGKGCNPNNYDCYPQEDCLEDADLEKLSHR